jgi:DNA polymerase (family X)
MDKHDVAKLLEDIATLLELQAENPFKIQAYHKAARAIENLDEEIQTVVQENHLKDLPGIGEKIAAKITTFVTTGSLPYYDELKKSVPENLELLTVAGLGGKKIKALYEKLGIVNINDLEKACLEGKVAELKLQGAFDARWKRSAISIFLWLRQIPIRLWTGLRSSLMWKKSLQKALPNLPCF